MEKIKKIKLWLPIAGYREVYLVRNKTVDQNRRKQSGFLCQFRTSEPLHSGEECRVLSLGVTIIRHDKKVQLGFIKRRQLLVKT